MINKLSILLFFIFLLLCCQERKKPEYSSDVEKEFYSSYGGWDYIRIPLSYPFDLRCFDENRNWYLKIGESNLIYTTIVVNKVDVVNSVIIAYAHKEMENFTGLEPYHWFIISTRKNRKVKKGFNSESEARRYLKKMGISEIDMQKPDDLHEQFKSNGCLKWINGCK